MIEIVGIGANVHDTLAVLPGFPGEDTKMRALSMTECGGGPCATGLVAASKLGAKAAYIGNASGDAQGRFLLADFKRYGVCEKYIGVIENTKSFSSFVLLNAEKATRTIVFDKGDVPPLELSGEQKKAVAAARLLMVDGNELTAATEAAKIARANKTDVLYDAGGLYEGVESLVKLTDILIPSEEFALAFTKEKTAQDAAKKLFRDYAPKVVVITRGKEGGVMYDGEKLRAYPAFAVKVLDTNGAGDVFHGAFAFAVTKGRGFYGACLFASAVSALKCTKVGARAGVPSYEETTQFLKECGIDEV